MSRPLSFYIHIPYCLKRCGYCDFNTYTPGELKAGSDIAEVSTGYIDLLIAESKIAKGKLQGSKPIETIFFGGGTPTLMEPADLGRVLDSLKSDFGFATNIEITIEANPDTVSKEKLAALRGVGINRISFGMQSAATHVLAVLDRTHNPENVIRATNWAREVGFEQVSVDLIYGTPGETIEDWRATIKSALELPITHISAYALIVEDGTKLAAQVKRGEIVIPDDDQTADKYLIADEEFSKAGFNWYELSNWAKAGGECRHNIAYWQGDNWWGLGPGAHSHIDGVRFWNVKHPTTYKKLLESNDSPVLDSETLVAEQIESERIMLAIRLPSGISKASLCGESLARIESYVTAGQLSAQSWEAGVVSLTRSGRLMADRIVREILLQQRLTMHLAHNILLGLLALVFLASGAMKLSGSEKGLAGTRDVNIGDRIARLIGLVEAVAAVGLIYAIRYPEELIGWLANLVLWIAMGVAIYSHSKANKMKSAVPAVVLLILLSATLVII